MVQVGSREAILLNPADACVSAFVRDVNRARVLTTAAAEQAAQRGEKTLDEALKTVPAVVPDTALEVVLPPMFASPWPVAMVDRVGAFPVIVPRDRVLAVLAGGE